jgi:hypothetical protein
MIQIGDTIRDVEDGDCYFEGKVTELNFFGGMKTYQVTRVFWSGVDEKDDDYIGKVIEPMWWYITKEKEI